MSIKYFFNKKRLNLKQFIFFAIIPNILNNIIGDICKELHLNYYLSILVFISFVINISIVWWVFENKKDIK